MARLRAHLRDEVRNRGGRACHGWRFLRLSDLTPFPVSARSHSWAAADFVNYLIPLPDRRGVFRSGLRL
ncbi:hypothetical protein D0A61_13925 [Pantoea agglomerans]|nr:hypothetical protein D0A61_13925 [Pantoea agglomerans]